MFGGWHCWARPPAGVVKVPAGDAGALGDALMITVTAGGFVELMDTGRLVCPSCGGGVDPVGLGPSADGPRDPGPIRPGVAGAPPPCAVQAMRRDSCCHDPGVRAAPPRRRACHRGGPRHAGRRFRVQGGRRGRRPCGFNCPRLVQGRRQRVRVDCPADRFRGLTRQYVFPGACQHGSALTGGPEPVQGVCLCF
jgi:hypothetical protein